MIVRVNFYTELWGHYCFIASVSVALLKVVLQLSKNYRPRELGTVAIARLMLLDGLPKVSRKHAVPATSHSVVS